MWNISPYTKLDFCNKSALLTNFLPKLSLFKPFLLFVIFQNVLASITLNNQGIIFILQIYADQKIFKFEMFIKMTVWQNGIHTLYNVLILKAHKAFKKGAHPKKWIMFNFIYLFFWNLQNLFTLFSLSFFKIWVCGSLSSERNVKFEGSLEMNRSY